MRLYDSVWGVFELSSIMLQFINTLEFQRLRFIKQLSNCDKIFNSATGTRFEHSIGASYVAKLFASHLQVLYPNLVDNRLIELYTLGGLLHDIGHGPYSHLFDKAHEHINSPYKNHEYRSQMIIKLIVSKYNISLLQDEVEFICDIIHPKFYQMNDWKYQIISNEVVDIDRIDYLLRDSKKLDINIPFNGTKAVNIIINSRIKDNQLVFLKNQDLQDFTISRLFMYKYVYKHQSLTFYDDIILTKLTGLYTNLEDFLKLDDTCIKN